MIMISIVICLALEFFTNGLETYRSWRWLDTWLMKMKSLLHARIRWDGPWGVLAVLILPLLLCVLLSLILDNVLLGIFELLFGILVLIYSLRYQPQDRLIDEVIDALEAGELIRANERAEKIIGHLPNAEKDLVKQVSDAIFVNINDRMFAVMFWFALLGPAGAIMYRMVWLYSRQDRPDEPGFMQSMRKLRDILDWIPVRLLIVGFAITGSFEEAIHEWREAFQEGIEDLSVLHRYILIHSGQGAIHIDRYLSNADETGADRFDVNAIRAARGLVLRTMLAWGIVVAVITLTGWAS